MKLFSSRPPPVVRRLLGIALALGLFDLGQLAWRFTVGGPDHPWAVPLRVASTLATLAAVGVVVLAVRRLQQALADAERARRTLAEAVEALPAGFELYGPDDRLVMVNRRMVEMYPLIADLADRHPSFEEVVRTHHARGGLPDLPEGIDAWLATRQQQRRQGGVEHLFHQTDGRWIRVLERRTSDGGLVGVRIDVTELQRLNAELGRLSETDALTGLANRRLFDQRLAEELSRAGRHGTALALAIVDVDHFKRYNDRHGHPAGDACLQQLATVLRETARRPGDLVARLGGEEFALLLPQDDAAAAAALGERCIAALDRAALPHGDSPVAPQVTISVGVADLTSLGAAPEERDASALLRAADRALYAAKLAGRHRVAVAPAHSGAD